MAFLRSISAIAPIALATALALGCGGDEGARGPGATIVDTVRVRTMDVPALVAAVGTVEADHRATVEPEVEGRVVRILRDEGSRVAAGDPVVQLDPAPYRDAVQSAEAELARARATLSADEKLLGRYDRLIEVGAIDPQTYENLQARVESERAAVQQARARLATARRELARSTVRAPFSGTVGKRMVQLGEYVRAGGGGDGGSGLFELVDATPVKVRFEVPETHVEEVDVGDRVRFRVRSDTVSARLAEVNYVSPRIDPETRTFEVTALYSNPDLRVRPGAFADVEVTTAVNEDAAVVPEEALYTEGEDNYVFVVADSTASKRPVEVGVRLDGLVEIREGVEPGEAVVTAGQHGLRDGAPVRIAPSETERLERG
ncbi:MAG: efflux RND transporter periplasmic adaptor subunit [Gemmatimonadota bacterium]|nr:efflux RND transporter periplasmic adaptor subunit [Gemmatimonadota bacterium]